MKSILLKTSVPAAVALLVSGLMFPFPAYAAPRDVGTIEVDCETEYLDAGTIAYLSIGDTFTIENAPYEPCLILDPNGILTGEDANHSGLGAGILEAGETSDPITIDGPGTFTITENAGLGAVVNFKLIPAFIFSNLNDVGVDPVVNDTFLYEGVTVIDGTTNVDATVTINALVNLDEGFILDESSGAQIGSGVTAADGMDGYAEYTIDFHAEGDPTTPISLSNFSLTVKDIDSLQYVAVEGVDSFDLSSSPATKLTARNSGSLLYVEELNDISSSSSDEDHWVVLNFSSTSTVTVRVGSRDGSASFGLLFTSTTFARNEFSSTPATVTIGSSTPSTPSTPATTATPTPTLATTGVNVEGLIFGSLTAVVAGSAFLTFSRRKRTA
jgi:hypothetical protein